MIDYELRRGGLVDDAVLRFTPNSGVSVLNFRIAQSNARWDDEAGRRVTTRAHYLDVVVWPVARGERKIDLPSMLADKLRRGVNVAVHGSFQTRKWVDKSGVDQWSTEFLADAVYLDEMSVSEWVDVPGSGAASGAGFGSSGAPKASGGVGSAPDWL